MFNTNLWCLKIKKEADKTQMRNPHTLTDLLGPIVQDTPVTYIRKHAQRAAVGLGSGHVNVPLSCKHVHDAGPLHKLTGFVFMSWGLCVSQKRGFNISQLRKQRHVNVTQTQQQTLTSRGSLHTDGLI